jgi:membrane fusion protein, multidrug efflux system
VSTKILPLFLLGLCCLAGILQWGCNSSKGEIAEVTPAKQTDAIRLKAKKADQREWISSVLISGNLRSRSSIEIKPEVSGRLIAVCFNEGDLVHKGQLLAEVDTVNYQLAYDQYAAALSVAQAGLEQAKVSAEHAETEKARSDNLWRSGGITQKDLQAAINGVKDAATQIQLAEAQCAQARAALAIADKAVKDCKIFALADGHVQKRFFDKGSLLTAGVPLYTLVDNSRLELESVIPSYQLAAVRIGQKSLFQTPTFGDRNFAGVVSAINPTVESDNRSVKAILQIANPRGELRAGMYARGEITTGIERNALIIPRDALIPEKEGSDNAGIYVVRDGKAHQIRIQIGGSKLDQVWVQKGLNEDDVVVTEIGPSLKEGSVVQVLP